MSHGTAGGRTTQADTPKQEQASREQETGKRHPDWKGRSTLSSFSDDMILYVGNPKECKRTYYEN